MSIIALVAEHLTALGLRFRQLDEEAISIAFTGDNTGYEAFIRARGSLVSVIAPAVAQVPRPRLDEAIRTVNLLNATRVSYGCFWVDPARSRVAFEVTIPAPEGPSQDQVGMAMAALSQIDDSFPALARVLWAGETAEGALAAPPSAGDEPPSLDLAV